MSWSRPTLVATGGDDTVAASVTFNLGTHGANVENLELTGTDHIDGTGNNLANRITGNGGANTLDGGVGQVDTLDGGGSSRYVIGENNDVVVETDTNLASGGDDTVAANVTFNLNTDGANVENWS